jgi:uncharacterized membrane protein
MFPFGKKKDLIEADDQEQIVAAIRAAEAGTTGEVRVYVESHCSYMDAMDRAKELFLSLSMDKTERRNAVIVYVAVKDHQYAIFGDKEIYEKAGGPVFWERAAAELRSYLKNGKIAQGLAVCVGELGRALAQHFPYDPSITKNELPDEIVFGK